MMIGTSIERLAVPADTQVLAAYAGKNLGPDGAIVTIRVVGARTFIQVPNQAEYELLPKASFTRQWAPAAS